MELWTKFKRFCASRPVVSKCKNEIIAILCTKRKIFCNFVQIQLKIKDGSLQFSLWLSQVNIFVQAFVTEKSLHPSCIFFWNLFLWINLIIADARDHCYDNATTMIGKKSSVTTQIKSLNEKCLYTNCHKCNVKLAVGDMIKNIPG